MGQMSLSYKIKHSGVEGASTDPQTFDDGLELVKFVKKMVINIAIDALKEEQAQGFEKDPVVVVNNERNKPVTDFSPLKSPTIRFISKKDLKDILIFAFNAIDSRTFRVTGRYLRSNIVTYNGRTVATDSASFISWLNSMESFGERDKVRFINIAPYARKLERYGVWKEKRGFGEKLKKRLAKRHEKKPVGTEYLVPNGIYALAYRSIKSKYQHSAMIKFDLVPGSAMGLTGPGTVYKTGESKGKSYLYPTILIYATSQGIEGLI